MDLPEIPALPGSYALLLSLDSPLSLPVGRLGNFNFPPANYLYFGSAWGPGGLKARLHRHIHGSPRVHWHIDFFRQASNLISAYFLPALNYIKYPVPLECTWSQAIAATMSAFIPVPHFGSSDCQQVCPAHLVGLPGRASLASRPSLATLAALPASLPVLLAEAAGVEVSTIHSIRLR